MRWDVAADHLLFSVQEIAVFTDVEEPTKRQVTSIVGKFYDPLGFLSPVVIKFNSRSSVRRVWSRTRNSLEMSVASGSRWSQV